MEMEVFKTEDNRAYVTVDMEYTKKQAATIANKHFKIKKDQLGCSHAWVKKDTLYFEEKRGAEKVWLFWRKSTQKTAKAKSKTKSNAKAKK